MVPNSPMAVLMANPVGQAAVLTEKRAGLSSNAAQARRLGLSFAETLNDATAKVDNEVKPQTALGQGETEAAAGRGSTEAAVGRVQSLQTPEKGDSQETVVELTIEEHGLMENAAVLGQTQVPPAAEYNQLLELAASQEVSPNVDCTTVAGQAAGKTVLEVSAQPAAKQIPVVLQADQALAQVTGQSENPAQVGNFLMAVNQSADKKGSWGKVSPEVQQKLAEFIQTLERLVDVEAGQVHLADAIGPGINYTAKPDQLSAEKGFVTPGVSTIARFADEHQVILGLQQALKQELAKLENPAEIPQHLGKIKDLINAQLMDKSPAGLGELLSRLVETLEQTGLAKRSLPQGDQGGLIFEAQGPQTAAARIKHEVTIPRATDDSGEIMKSLDELPATGRMQGSAGTALGTVGADLAKRTLPETTSDNNLQLPKVITTDKTEVQLQNLQVPSENKSEARTAATYETAGAGEKQAQVTKMDFGIVNQIAQKVKISAGADKTEMQIQLKPEFLGKLDLIVSTENGLVTAKFNTGSVHVKAMIEANLNGLRDALTEQGVRVDQLTVTVSSERDFSGFQHREQAQQQNRFTRGNKAAAKETDLEEMLANREMSLISRKHHGGTVDFMA